MFGKIYSRLPEQLKFPLRRMLGPLTYQRRSFSQEGEDLFLERILDLKVPGVYVDVGAHHPYRYSNTYRFYKRGWKGINIDARPGSMHFFSKRRPRDHNLETGISRVACKLEYYMFSESALNTFDAALATQRSKEGSTLVDKRIVQCAPLAEIMAQYPLIAGCPNSFLSVDTEGLDLEVLKSNDWKIFRPSVVVVETYDTSLESFLASELAKFMESVEYVAVAKLAASAMFRPKA